MWIKSYGFVIVYRKALYYCSENIILFFLSKVNKKLNDKLLYYLTSLLLKLNRQAGNRFNGEQPSPMAAWSAKDATNSLLH